MDEEGGRTPAGTRTPRHGQIRVAWGRPLVACPANSSRWREVPKRWLEWSPMVESEGATGRWRWRSIERALSAHWEGRSAAGSATERCRRTL